MLCPDNIFPNTGIFSIIGIFIFGKTKEFKDVEAPLSPVNKYTQILSYLMPLNLMIYQI